MSRNTVGVSSSNHEIRPIETRYKGYRFRSRLEARWAVFFDALGVKWKYESEGYILPNGRRYLPDFFLSYPDHPQFRNAGYWIEIKGSEVTDEEIEKFSMLCSGTGHNGSLCIGLPGENPPVRFHRTGEPPDFGEPDVDATFKAYKFFNRPFKNPVKQAHYNLFSGDWHFCTRKGRPSSEEYFQAADIARAARFEFNEHGDVR